MANLFKSISIERDPGGNLVVQFQFAIGIILIALALVPVVGVAGFVFSGNPLKIPLPFVGAGFVVVAALGAAAMVWSSSKTRARVSVDRVKSSVLLESPEGKKELRIREIEKAEIGSSQQASKQGTVTVYRLEFVLRNKERVPASPGYYSASPADLEKLLEAVNGAIGK